MYNEIFNKLGARTLKRVQPANIEDIIKEVETTLKAKLPNTYKLILNNFNGSIVFDNGAKYKAKIKSPMADSLGFQDLEVIYGVLESDNDLIAKNIMFYKQLPLSVITIGEASGGDQICMNRESGHILF